MKNPAVNPDSARLEEQFRDLKVELRSASCESQTESRLFVAKKVLGLINRVKQLQRGSGALTDTENRHCSVTTPPNPMTENNPGEGVQLEDLIATAQKPQCVGRFVIKQQLGQGGYGLVFRAYDPQLGRDVALKLPRPEVIMTESGRKRFVQEAKAAAALSHPNIVPVFESGGEGPFCFIAYEYIAGPTLAECQSPRAADSTSSQRRAAKMISVLADAVHHAHQRGVLHRDLKPSNVILRRSPAAAPCESAAAEPDFEIPMITDFGLAKVMLSGEAVEPSAELSNQTQTGSIIGTPAYMSPEQTSARQIVDARTDVYSLGAILYERLTGEAPFQGDSLLETLRNVQQVEPICPRKRNAETSSDLAAICMKCLEKSPDDRYPSAFELHRDLQRFLDGRPVVARTASNVSKLLKWRQRNPRLAASMLTAITAIVIGLTAVTTLWIRSDHLRGQAEARGLALAIQKSELESSAAQLTARSQQLNAALRELFLEVARSEEIKSPGAGPLREAILQRAKRFYEELSTSTIATGTRLHRCETLYELARVHEYLGEPRQSLSLIQQALRIADEDPNEGFPAKDLIKYQVYAAGRLLQLGQLSLADRAFDRAIHLVDQFDHAALDDDSDIHWQLDRAWLLTRQADARIAAKDIAGAFELTGQALRYFKEIVPPSIEHSNDYRFSKAICYWIHGRAHRDRGHHEESQQCLETAVELLTEISGSELYVHHDARLRLGQCLYELGVAHSRQSELADARRCYSQAVKLFSELPDILDLQQIKREEFLRVGYSLAVSEMLLENYEQAEQAILNSLEPCHELMEQYPGERPKYLDRLADRFNLLYIVRVRSSGDRYDQAEAAIRQAIQTYEEAIELRPAWQEPRRALAQSVTNLGNVLERQNRLDEALREYARSESILEEILADHPDWSHAKRGKRNLLLGRMYVANKQQRYQDALELCLEAQALLNTNSINFMLLDESLIQARLQDFHSAEIRLQSFVSQARRPNDFVAAAQKAMEIASLAENQGQRDKWKQLAISLLQDGLPSDPEPRHAFLTSIEGNENLRQLLARVLR